MNKKNFSFLLIFSLIILILLTFFLNKNSQSNNKSHSKVAYDKIIPTQNKHKSVDYLNSVALPQLNKKINSDNSVALLMTSKGNIKIKLFNKYTPLAVDNFMTHAQEGYYDNSSFHRIIKNFMIQGGKPAYSSNNNQGHSIWYNKNHNIDSGFGFKNEISSSLYNINGAISMANTGQPNSNGSQFFINNNHINAQATIQKKSYPYKIWENYQHGGNPYLDGNYTVFGQVISGMNVVNKINNVKTNNTSPLKKVSIIKIKIIKSAPIKISQ